MVWALAAAAESHNASTVTAQRAALGRRRAPTWPGLRFRTEVDGTWPGTASETIRDRNDRATIRPPGQRAGPTMKRDVLPWARGGAGSASRPPGARRGRGRAVSGVNGLPPSLARGSRY